MNPCLHCGACCACFRVDFAVHELLSKGGTVPDGLAVEVNASTYRMRGTDRVQTTCGIYEWRPAPCQEFAAGSAACARARLRHGLAPLDD